MQVIMEIRHGGSKACLYELPTYEEWFNSHSYEWRYKNRTFEDKPNKEFTEMYQRARARHLKWQGTLIKTFMANCNGHKEKPQCRQQPR